MIKVYAFESSENSNDYLCIKVMERIKEKLEKNITNIKFKTLEKKEFSNEEINDDDVIIVLESTCFMGRVGSVTILDFDDLEFVIEDDKMKKEEISSKRTKEKDKKVRKYILGIEVENTTEAYKKIVKRFDNICQSVYSKICMVI